MERPLLHLRPLLAGLQLENSMPSRPTTSEGSIQRRLGSLSRSPSVNSNLKPSVECAEVCENAIYLGTSDGCIVQITIGERVAIGNPQQEAEFTLSDTVATLCMSGNTICFADSSDYKVMDMERGEVTPVIPVTPPSLHEAAGRSLSGATKPLITVIGDSEYLLASATSSTHILAAARRYILGIFISLKGDPSRGTLEWPSYPRSIVYTAPYVVALLRNHTITVHHMDQLHMVQTIDVRQPQPRSLILAPGMIMTHTSLARKLSRPDMDATEAASTCERLFFVGPDAVTALVMESIIEQADHYLDSNRVEEAIVNLERHMASHEVDSSMKSTGLLYIYRKAGLICLGETLFDDALAYFRKGKLDPRLLANFFPHLSLRHYDVPMEQDIQQHARSLESIHHIVEKQLAAFNSVDDKTLERTFISNAHEMLLRYLKMCKESAGVPAGEFAEDLDTLLLRLYTEVDPAGLLNLLKEDNTCRVEACERWLEERQHHYALSLLYKSQHRLYDAMVLWQRIADGELVDASFGGLQEFTDTLLEAKNASLLQTFTPWILTKDTPMGIKMLCQLQAMPDGPLSDQSMLSMVRQYGIGGLVDFLEHLVLVRRTTDPIHHDALADIYIERLGELWTPACQEELLDGFREAQAADGKVYFAAFLQRQRTPPAQMRARLLQFLQTSTLYNPETVLNALSRIELYSVEACIVLAKLHRYEEALRLLVDKLNDCVGAELFCHCGGTFSLHPDGATLTRDNQLMFTTLLSIYLQQPPPQQEINVTRLLTCFSQSLDAIETLHSIPDAWSADIMTQFLIQSIRKSTGTSRELRLLRALAHTELTKRRPRLHLGHDRGGRQDQRGGQRASHRVDPLSNVQEAIYRRAEWM
ncbi:hypothetical protein SYNPS1DRAFT_27302 [Syncephalis pseudoplumigaleata]|uniref:CNH domain-containing protein n=1 Tax=Syncephalis pseudoplumigaleata TaxID=1712513 RepID=A0A4P9Z3K0_9FUNG|nr:hypothetical protein SYNPS1DRAFT_27302 [Syncephalis pseudoplumigaleata]|eukprot:RKP27036.1 hypothetical protein SYNPS1DRAFT_27302 [Syncephalis pseudoplumigaleata]